jgi:chromosome segregation ATPase
MKRSDPMRPGFFLLVLLLSGCVTLPSIKNPITAGQGDLYSQVPAAMRAPVKEAEYDLKQAKASVDLAKEKVKLAEMKKQRAGLENEYADCGMKIAETKEKKAQAALEVKKLEAVDNANLGDKEKNIKKLADLRTQELSIESDNIRMKADLDTLDLKIKKLTKEIDTQEKKVKK